MHLRAVLQPVGPQPPVVYWRRRLVVLAVVGAAVLLLVHACGGGGTETVGTSGGGSRAGGTATKPGAACASGVIRVTATTDAARYPAGARPRLTMRVTNTGKRPCVLAVGEGVRHFTVISGPDTVWSTDHCPHPNTVVRTTLKPGAAIAYSRTWDRHRSVRGCANRGESAAPGTYRFIAVVAGVRSGEAVFHLSS